MKKVSRSTLRWSETPRVSARSRFCTVARIRATAGEVYFRVAASAASAATARTMVNIRV